MLAAFRAEMLVMRKTRVAWALVAAIPLIVLIAYDLGPYVEYLIQTHGRASQTNNAVAALASLSPSQFVRLALEGFLGLGPDVAMILGALVGAGDWEMETLKSSLLAGPSRACTVVGQAAALWVALAVGTLGGFAVTLVASLTVRLFSGGLLPPGYNAIPPAGGVARGILGAILISAAYGTIGLAIGMLLRSIAGAIVACLIYIQVVETGFGSMSYMLGGASRVIYDHLPAASATTLALMFGLAGGGGALLPLSPIAAVYTLVIYTAASLALTVVILCRRDVNVGGTRLMRSVAERRVSFVPTALGGRIGVLSVDSKQHGWISGFLLTMRAELFVIARWPAFVASRSPPRPTQYFTNTCFHTFSTVARLRPKLLAYCPLCYLGNYRLSSSTAYLVVSTWPPSCSSAPGLQGATGQAAP